MGQVVENLVSLEPTYSDIGATLAQKQPEGYRHDTMRPCLAADLRSFIEPSSGSRPGKRAVCLACGGTRRLHPCSSSPGRGIGARGRLGRRPESAFVSLEWANGST
jgi:hypothetical protein